LKIKVALYKRSLGDAARARARTVEPLIRLLEDEDFSVRAAAAASLGDIGDTRAVEALILALDDPEMHSDAALSLGMRARM
jgi:HEAT repeat protein